MGKAKHQQDDTAFSEDGCTVFVRLRVDRRHYEYARKWAAFHGPAMPDGTAEDQLEGYISAALDRAIAEDGWKAAPEIEALYPKPAPYKKSAVDMDDDIPF